MSTHQKSIQRYFASKRDRLNTTQAEQIKAMQDRIEKLENVAAAARRAADILSYDDGVISDLFAALIHLNEGSKS